MWNGVPEDWGKGCYRDIPWSKYVLLARERQKRDLRRAEEQDPNFPFYFDWQASEHAVWFASLLRQFEGQFYGQTLSLSDWQEWDLIRPLFGWKKLDGTRRFSQADIFLTRKQGKSTLAAFIGAYMQIADKEFGAQVASAATKEDQARIVFEAAARMLRLSPELGPEIKQFKKSIFNEQLGSRFFPLGRDSKTQDGLNLHCAIIDEYHAHKTAEMRNVCRSSMGNRRQPLLVTISTLGYGDKTPCDEEFELACALLDGRLENENKLVFLATVDDPEKWEDETEWIKANPNMGITMTLERFRADFESAVQSPRYREEFKCKRLNIKGKKYGQWLPMEKWNAGGVAIDWSFFKGKRCFGGLDLGITRDISALSLAFLGDEKPNPSVYVLMRYWIAEEGMYERFKNDGVSYPTWAEQGWITTTPGNTTRYDIIRKDINDLADEFEIKEIAVDRAHAHQLMQELADDGFDVVKHAQTMLAMNMPCRSFEELVLQQRIRHGNDPVLRWMVSNVAIVRDGNENIKVVKDRSGDRVDGVVAAIMAIGRLLIAPQPQNFVYNIRKGIYVG